VEKGKKEYAASNAQLEVGLVTQNLEKLQLWLKK